MPSYKFNIYRYTYTADIGDEFVREQRIALDNQTSEPLYPPTNLFLQRVVSFPDEQKKIKAEKFKEKERRAKIKFRKGDGDISETSRYIPYENPELIKQYLIEVSQVDNFLCQDYIGESRDFNVSPAKI